MMAALANFGCPDCDGELYPIGGGEHRCKRCGEEVGQKAGGQS